MGSSSSKSRISRPGNSGSRRPASLVLSSTSQGSSGKRRRVTLDQMQSTRLAFGDIVTFNPIFSHQECFIRQLNWWMLDGKLNGPAFRLNKGGPAGPEGECGSVGQWNFCTMSQKFQSPPPYHDIGPAAPDFNIQAGLSQVIYTTIQLCLDQPLEDANVRTAILFLVERLAYHGIAIRPDLDLFSIYAHLKSLSAANRAPSEEAVGTRVMNIMSLATVRAPVHWENRMVLANRIKVELHADILEVQLYYRELQALSGRKLRSRLERDKDRHFVLYSRFRLLFPHPDLSYN